jgi:enamine deaminase RidA (YjgF/YER057c/UK114 family)
MTIQPINPADLPAQATYTHVVVAAGTALVFIAGQEPEDVHGTSVAPGDLAGQARPVYANLGRALTAAGARPDPGRQAHHLRGGLHIRIPAGHRASQGGAVRAP